MLFSCSEKDNKETFYILYHGNQDISFPDLVIKNSSESFVDSIMPIGSPIIVEIERKEFEKLKESISSYEYTKEDENNYGILIIHYIGSNNVGKYFFNIENETVFLNNMVKNNIKTNNEMKTVNNWIKDIKNIEDKFRHK